MKRKIVILFTCVGRRVSLVRSFRQACSRLGCQSVIIGTDTTKYSPALLCCDRQYIVRPIADKGYYQDISKIITQEKVDILIPTIDLDLSLWAQKRKSLARRGCTALISKPEVVAVTHDKRLTHRFLVEHGFDSPDTLSARQALKNRKNHFPCFLKPWDGHASLGARVVRNREELKFYSKNVPNSIVQELIEGQEHTVDVLVDFAGQVRCVVPRRRIAVRGGEVSKGVTVKNSLIIEQCKQLVETLAAGPGVITLQCFLTPENKVKFIEINPRFGGGVPLAIKAGAAFPRWILQLWMGQNPRISFDRWRDGLVMLRYDEAVWYDK